MNDTANHAPFSPRTVIFIVVAGVLAFAAFLLLMAFAPDFRSGHDARAHALSTAATGYAGLVSLTEATGSYSVIVRDTDGLRTTALLVVTPESDSDPAALLRLVQARSDRATLIVLPKWWTRPLPNHNAWVQADAVAPPSSTVAALHKLAPGLSVEQMVEQTPFGQPPAAAPGDTPRLARAQIGPQKEQQRLIGRGFTPVLIDHEGRTVIGQIGAGPLYVLAEPDLLNNQGIADLWTARQGWRVISDLAPTNEVAFDLTTNGFARQRNPLKLVFEAPFLPVTLCIVAAGLLAGLHGAFRFGAPVASARAIALGKRALVDNAAQLFRAARKEHRVGAAYAALTRDLAAQETAAPPRLSDDALNHWLDRAGRHADDQPYATLAWLADTAEDRDQLLGAARALYRWRRNRTR